MLLASRLFFFLSHAARYFETCAQSKLRTPTNLDITALDGIFCIGGVHTGIEKVTLPRSVVMLIMRSRINGSEEKEIPQAP